MEVMMKNAIYLIVILLLGVITNATADSVCTASYQPVPETIWSTIKDRYDNDCYRAEIDKYRQAFGINVGSKNFVENKNKTYLSWRMLRDLASADEVDPKTIMSELFNSIRKRANAAADSVYESTEANKAKGFAGPSSWEIKWRIGILPTIKEDIYGVIKLKENIIEACSLEISNLPNNETEQCALVYKQSKMLINIILVGNSIGRYYGKPIIQNVASDIDKVNKEWDAFLFNSKPMFPLDLIVTDFLYRTFSDYNKSNEGFRRPPEWQWFFLHPAPAFDYVSGAVDGEQLKPSVYLEVIGFNVWEKEHITGVSFIGTYSDRNDLPDGGYGFLFTYRNTYSVAITKYGSETGVLFGLDVASFFRESLRPAIVKLR